MASRALADLGYDAEASAFRRFAERTAAGRAADLRVFYGVGGECRSGPPATCARPARPARS